MARLRGFTLVELLVILAIISVIAGLIFPVFAGARASAIKTSCTFHFKQVTLGSIMYTGDYDDMFAVVNYQPASTPNSHNDRTWVQLLLPYLDRSFTMFECPGDYSVRPQPEATFDQDLIPGDIYSEYYTASLRSNVGYNFQYLAPVVKIGGQWTAMPKLSTSIADASKMLMYVDSVWSVVNGVPVGGGSWLVSPPCRYESVNGREVDTIAAGALPPSVTNHGDQDQIFAPMKGWGIDEQDSFNAYGGAWAWHRGYVNVSNVDGHEQSLTMAQLTQGCDVQPSWQGDITDPNQYLWWPN